MHPDRSAASDQGRDRRGRTDAKPRVPGRANPTKTGGGKLVDLQAYAKRCDDRVEPSGKRSQPEAEQVPPVQDDRVQGPAGIRAASGPIPDTSFPRARGATWIAGAADDVEWDAPRAGIHPHRAQGKRPPLAQGYTRSSQIQRVGLRDSPARTGMNRCCPTDTCIGPRLPRAHGDEPLWGPHLSRVVSTIRR